MSTKAQPGKEAWHWQFGNLCSLDFSSGSPNAGTNSFFDYNGCASVSDPNTGQLLFYASGTTAFNKNGNPMWNGNNLKGSSLASQAALIIPKPGSPTIYYLITADACASNNHGIRYNEVDLTQQSGLGAVTLKNQLLTPSIATERLVGVRHCNGTDYWILSHPFNSNAFNAYLVTSAGINTIPVISNAGIFEQYLSGATSGSTHYYWEGSGYLKASPNGKKLALGTCSDSMPTLELFDFDNSTGVVNNPMVINYPGAAGPLGLTFS
ncbi:MAG: hypothetical protein HY089_06960, partial [Ignavibacteriales bacterium]|nr:hypothetical protein [Ignavibacteriales bacterium]